MKYLLLTSIVSVLHVEGAAKAFDYAINSQKASTQVTRVGGVVRHEGPVIANHTLGTFNLDGSFETNGLAGQADGVLRGQLTTSGIFDPASQTLVVKPTGNELPTLATWNVQGFSKSLTSREFLVSIGFTVDAGRATRQIDGSKDKVSQYVAINCITSGGGGCWASNTLARVEKGWFASGAFGAAVSEIDIDNFDQHTGEADGVSGLSGASIGAIGITGAGSKRVTSAVSIAGPGDHTIFNRGYVISSNAVRQCSFCDYGIADIALDIRGTHNGAVLDTSKANAGVAIRLGNGQYLTAITAKGTGAQIMVLGKDDYVGIATMNVKGVRLAPAGIPVSTGGAFQATRFITTQESGEAAFGVSCPAGSVNLSTLTVTNGIITHC